jgi:hypothetical protein
MMKMKELLRRALPESRSFNAEAQRRRDKRRENQEQGGRKALDSRAGAGGAHEEQRKKSPSFARIGRLKPAPPKQSELRLDCRGLFIAGPAHGAEGSAGEGGTPVLKTQGERQVQDGQHQSGQQSSRDIERKVG